MPTPKEHHPFCSRDDLKPELSGLSAEPKLGVFGSLFVAAVKDTLVVGIPSAERVVNNPSEL